MGFIVSTVLWLVLLYNVDIPEYVITTVNQCLTT